MSDKPGSVQRAPVTLTARRSGRVAQRLRLGDPYDWAEACEQATGQRDEETQVRLLAWLMAERGFTSLPRGGEELVLPARDRLLGALAALPEPALESGRAALALRQGRSGRVRRHNREQAEKLQAKAGPTPAAPSPAAARRNVARRSPAPRLEPSASAEPPLERGGPAFERQIDALAEVVRRVWHGYERKAHWKKETLSPSVLQDPAFGPADWRRLGALAPSLPYLARALTARMDADGLPHAAMFAEHLCRFAHKVGRLPAPAIAKADPQRFAAAFSPLETAVNEVLAELGAGELHERDFAPAVLARVRGRVDLLAILRHAPSAKALYAQLCRACRETLRYGARADAVLRALRAEVRAVTTDELARRLRDHYGALAVRLDALGDEPASEALARELVRQDAAGFSASLRRLGLFDDEAHEALVHARDIGRYELAATLRRQAARAAATVRELRADVDPPHAGRVELYAVSPELTRDVLRRLAGPSGLAAELYPFDEHEPENGLQELIVDEVERFATGDLDWLRRATTVAAVAATAVVTVGTGGAALPLVVGLGISFGSATVGLAIDVVEARRRGAVATAGLASSDEVRALTARAAVRFGLGLITSLPAPKAGLDLAKSLVPGRVALEAVKSRSVPLAAAAEVLDRVLSVPIDSGIDWVAELAGPLSEAPELTAIAVNRTVGAAMLRPHSAALEHVLAEELAAAATGDSGLAQETLALYATLYADQLPHLLAAGHVAEHFREFVRFTLTDGVASGPA